MSERQKEARTRNWLLKMLACDIAQCTTIIGQSHIAGLSKLEANALEIYLKGAIVSLEKATDVMRLANVRIHQETLSLKEINRG